MLKVIPSATIAFLVIACYAAQGFQLHHPRVSTKAQSTKSIIPRFATPLIEKTDEEWKEELPPEVYYVLREDGTERPWTSSLNDIKEDGTFYCRGCNQPLYRTRTKYESGSGWPSFWSPIDKDSVSLTTDFKLLLPRTEVRCASCGGHLGHVFGDGPQPTGQRYCMNGVAMTFRADEYEDEDILKEVLERESNALKVKPPVISVALPAILYTGVSLLYFNSFISRIQEAQDGGYSYPANPFDLLPLGLGGLCFYLATKELLKLMD